MKSIRTLSTFLFLLCLIAKANAADKPNILLILADDMGYSDLGSWGSEIETPHIDRLAHGGLRYTQFRNTGRCCPSRAALLTGRHQHSVDMGWMTAVDEHREGYRGQLSRNYPTLAETLQQNGYKTYMAGKWHLTLDGSHNKQKGNSKPNGSWPTDRGFDEFYGKLSGGGGYKPAQDLVDGTTWITKNSLPKDWYYTDAITQASRTYIETHDFSQAPLFLYTAHYAPHRPLQAPQDRIERCRERYEVGYDVLMQQRFENMQALGIIPSKQTLPTHPQAYKNGRPAWKDLTPAQQEKWITEMATYAAMIEIMDDGIGQLMTALEKKGQLDNTLILFLSDNGATREGGFISQLAADLSNTPYRSYKKYTLNGGISSPLIVHWPAELSQYKGEFRAHQSHITDLVPTILEATRIEQANTFRGKQIPPLHGTSLVPTFQNEEIETRNFYFEHQTSRAIISDTWKLVSRHLDEPWELYDLSQDPFEQNNLASAYRQKAKQLKKAWNKWASKNDVTPLETLPWTNRIKHYQNRYTDQSGRE